MSDKTDVWMPIYIGDYLADTIGLSYSAHGLYIMLIFSYWRKGRALDKGEVEDVMRHASETDAARIKTYFKIRGEKWFHDRIERELAKALDNRNKRKTSATIASNKRWEKERASKAALYVAHPSRIRHASPSPSPSPLAREREYSEPSTPTLEEVLAVAAIIGLADWKATDWFHEMEGCGWKDFQNRDVKSWRSIMTRVKTKWEADGRPPGPPVSKHATGGNVSTPKNRANNI